MHGFICIDKPAGISSFAAVRRVAKALGVRKAGHAGTLDPFATGVLPVAVGEATKAVRYLHLASKTYRATVRFGVRTDTLDVTGATLDTCDASGVTAARVAAALPAFVGEILQRPPAYSAVKVDGERAYARARRGEAAEPSPRKVAVHAAALLSMEGPEAVIEVRCGAGTYIRAIARDLGEALGTGAVLSSLNRTAYGPFVIGDAVEPDRADPSRLFPVAIALGEIPAVVIPPPAEERVRRGARLDGAFFGQFGLPQPEPGGRLALIDDARRLVAVVAAPATFPAAGRCEVERVFNEKADS